MLYFQHSANKNNKNNKNKPMLGLKSSPTQIRKIIFIVQCNGSDYLFSHELGHYEMSAKNVNFCRKHELR